MKYLSNEGLHAIRTVLWDSRSGSTWLHRGSEETFCQGGGQISGKKKSQEASILTAKNNRQFTEETQKAVNYDKEMLDITDN